MVIPLKDALEQTFAGWREDVEPAWHGVFRGVDPGFDAVDPALTLEPWEPIFPARRGRRFPGAPPGAHVFRAFDDLPPENVRCVIVGQDPYPCPAFATGRAFEAGNVAEWRELDKMFSRSVRAFVQLIVAARTGEARYAAGFEGWPLTLSGVEGGRLALEAPSALAGRWVASGVLLLNSALTLTRFESEPGAHQVRGHLPLWRPLLRTALHHLAARPAPVVLIGFGDVAAATLRAAGLGGEDDGSGSVSRRRVILRPHPAAADDLLARENPFTLCNRHLEAMGGVPIDW